MKKYVLILAVLMLATGLVSAQSNAKASDSSISPGLTPASPLYGIEIFAEHLEVKIAGAIGGDDMKAKALANNAEERVSEAQSLVEKNRSDKAAEAIERYSKTLNRSIDLASRGQDEDLKQKINNISDKNVETLKQVKKKVPEQAKGAIEKAINQSEKRRGPPEKPMNRTENPANNKSELPDVPGKDNERTKRSGKAAENISERTKNPVENKAQSTNPNLSEDAEKHVNATEDVTDVFNSSSENEDSYDKSSENNKIAENNSLTGLR